MIVCDRCGAIGGSLHRCTPHTRNVMTAERTPSLVALDTAEEAVITAARALRDLAPPPARINNTADQIADDLWFTAYHRLLDALDRLKEAGEL